MLLRSTEHHVCCTFGAERVVCGVYLYPGEVCFARIACGRWGSIAY